MSDVHLDARRGAWRAALACMVCLAVAMGLGRFAFTPALPLMLHEGKLNLQGAGLLASLNYLGYFVGALSAAAIHAAPPRMVRIGLVATAALLVGMGLTAHFLAWGVMRTVAGVASAWAFVFSSGWGLRRLAETGKPELTGFIYAGPGIGILVAGLVGGLAGTWGANAAWLVYGGLAAVCSAAVWRIFDDPHPPLAPLADGRATPAPKALASAASDARWLIALYGLAGFGYIITATFLPVIARQALPGSAWPDLFWPMFGLAVIVGAIAGARVPARWDNRLLLAAGYGMQALGVLLSVVWPSVVGFALGSLLLGLPFTAITMFAMRDARRLRGNNASGLIGLSTASYGVGQILGPLFAAPLAQRTGNFSVPLLVAASVLAFGGLMFVWVWRRRALEMRNFSANVL
ncbi:YbfB/YjiJ family MFS transporter [Variovorax dokdonensis]|uniref:YbfB/YjiJ family MFS transporter n=1 Tax=Variovorax dokdonensis TaxID=344883 RepID=A0ABT7NH91_9BURK|nr:YbfB/YjiJ family MFS transporter [Variovorax dokdonensis]MDM0047272.1 YbfB/YjiJ family MFS transporter [Variovorax dokdonensis]